MRSWCRAITNKWPTCVSYLAYRIFCFCSLAYVRYYALIEGRLFCGPYTIKSWHSSGPWWKFRYILISSWILIKQTWSKLLSAGLLWRPVQKDEWTLVPSWGWVMSSGIPPPPTSFLQGCPGEEPFTLCKHAFLFVFNSKNIYWVPTICQTLFFFFQTLFFKIALLMYNWIQ